MMGDMEGKPRQGGGGGEDHPHIIHKTVVLGTLSLGLLLIIGGLIIVGIGLSDQAEFKGAELDDFQSLGDASCVIESIDQYDIVEEQLQKLNSVCRQEWQYIVRVKGNNDTFLSEVFAHIACKTKCELCNKYRAESTYEGLPVSNENVVECWAPRSTTSAPADYYGCDIYQSDTCYKLEDPSIGLKEVMESTKLTMMAAYVGAGMGGFFVLLAVWLMVRNYRISRSLKDSSGPSSSSAEPTQHGMFESNDD